MDDVFDKLKANLLKMKSQMEALILQVEECYNLNSIYNELSGAEINELIRKMESDDEIVELGLLANKLKELL